MKEIHSKDNKAYKMAQSLIYKKHRERLSAYLIEGERLMEEALKNKKKLEKVFLSSEKSKEKMNDWMRWEHGGGGQVYVISQALFKNLSQTENSQGIIGVVRKDSFFEEELINGTRGKNIIVLDRLQDPGNIGTIIRTADGAGYGLILALKGTADVFSPKVVRAAMGSLFRIPIFYIDGPDSLMEFIRKSGKKLVATSSDGERYYYEENLKKDIALIIGNEGNGISNALINQADVRVKLPMNGNIESLNASVAAGILIYEAMRP